MEDRIALNLIVFRTDDFGHVSGMYDVASCGSKDSTGRSFVAEDLQQPHRADMCQQKKARQDKSFLFSKLRLEHARMPL